MTGETTISVCEHLMGGAEAFGVDNFGNPLCADCFNARQTSREARELLSAAARFIDRFLVLPSEAERCVLPLWIAHTHALPGAHATPYLLILSPEKRSGKTRVLEITELMVARPWRVTGASEAAIFRKIAQEQPTLLLDEIDAIFGAFSERTEPLRAILNAGNRPGATVARCVGEKGDQVKDFPVYSAKCLAGIDNGERIPDTIRDRSITISMRRRTGAEPVERLRHRDAKADAIPLRDELTAWGAEASAELLDARPTIPSELDDRAAEAWEPLLAIADLAGAEWPQRARAAALALSTGADLDEQSLGSVLLAGIRDTFGDRDRITTTALLEAINDDEELPFGGWRDGQGLDSRKLAKLLKPYKIKPRTIRVGDDANHRGYLREQFEDAWQRWTPSPPTEAPQAPQAPQAADDAAPEPHSGADVVDVVGVVDISPGVADGADRGATVEQEAEAERLTAKFGDAA